LFCRHISALRGERTPMSYADILHNAPFWPVRARLAPRHSQTIDTAGKARISAHRGVVPRPPAEAEDEAALRELGLVKHITGPCWRYTPLAEKLHARLEGTRHGDR
jgi:hypothetical protein